MDFPAFYIKRYSFTALLLIFCIIIFSPIWASPIYDKSEVSSGDYASGELIFISPEKMITAEGRQIYFSKETLFIKNGLTVNIDQIKTKVRVFVILDPLTRLAKTLEAVDLSKRSGGFGENPPPITDINVLIDGEKISGNPYVRKGQIITVTLTSPQGGKGAFEVAGIARDVAMREIRPGVFKGEVKILKGDAKRSYIIGRSVSKQGESFRIIPFAINIAVTPPEIVPVSPGEGEILVSEPPAIFARLYSCGSIIDARRTEVWLNGKPLNSGVEKNVEYVKAQIPPGGCGSKNTVKIVAFDEAGNKSSVIWDFKVEAVKISPKTR